MDRYFRNLNGVWIRRCCASCMNNSFNNGKKSCRIGEHDEQGAEITCLYKMKEFFVTFAPSKGRVKRKEYIEWLSAYMTAEESAGRRSIGADALIPISELRKTWEKKNKMSVYLDGRA